MESVKFNLSIDGNYGFHLFQYLKNEKRKLINWRKLESYIKKFIFEQTGDECLINIRRYFMGNSYKMDDPENPCGQDRKDYQNSLTLSNVQPVLVQKQGRKEAGVDIRLSIDAVKYMHDAGVKYFVLFSGDGDFCTLLDELHDGGNLVVLVQGTIPATFDRRGTYNSTVLNSQADYIIDLLVLLDTNPEIFDDCSSEISSYCYGRTNKSTEIHDERYRLEDSTLDSHLECKNRILTPDAVENAIVGLINEKRIRGINWKFVLLADLGNYLIGQGYEIPYPGLKQYLEANGEIFYIGSHPATGHPTVSLKNRYI